MKRFKKGHKAIVCPHCKRSLVYNIADEIKAKEIIQHHINNCRKEGLNGYTMG